MLVPYEYVTHIQRAEGLVLMIAPDEHLTTNPDEVLDLIDGLILAGGADVDPSGYGAETHPATLTRARARPHRDRAGAPGDRA